MLSSSRFAVAVHVLGLLSHYGEKGPVCSAVIAKSVDTNPVVIRRLMSQLESHGLVSSSTGRSGGFLLARAADQISLSEIYQAVEDEQFFRMHKSGVESDCPLATRIMKNLMPKLAVASQAMTKSLSQTKLSDLIMQQTVSAVA
jgi:Rrf2 family protein